MDKKRLSLTSALAALVLTVPFAVAVHADTTAPVTINVGTWGSSPAEAAALNDTIATFEARNPGIAVNLVVDTGNYETDMAAKFASNTAPDAFYLNSSDSQLWQQQGVLADLTPFITASKFSLSAFNPSYLTPYKQGGQIIGLPKDANPLVLEGNSILMKKAGIKALPTTVAQFDAQAKLLMAKKILPMCVDADLNRLGAWMVAFGGGISDASNTKSMLQSAGSVAAMTWVMNNYKTGVFKTPAQLSEGWAGSAFGNGKCAYTMEGAWLDPSVQSQNPAIYKAMVKGPLPTAKQAGSLAFTAAWAMAKGSTQQAAAWTFIQYMTEARGMTVWTSYGVAIPSRTDVSTPFGYAVNGQVAVLKTTKTTPSFPAWNNVVTAFNNAAKAQIQTKKFVVASAVKAILAAGQAAWKTS